MLEPFPTPTAAIVLLRFITDAGFGALGTTRTAGHLSLKIAPR